MPEQFVNYWKRTLTWDLGESFQNRRSVNEILGDKAVNSLRLGIWAILIEIIVGIAVGLVAAIRRYSFTDKLTTIVTAGASAIPVFVLGFILQYGFAVVPEQARLAGVGRACAPRASGPDSWTFFFIPTGEQWRYLILPGRHPGLGVDRAGRPHDPGLDARGAAGRLHAHGPGQGPAGARRHRPPRPAQRHAPGRSPSSASTSAPSSAPRCSPRRCSPGPASVGDRRLGAPAVTCRSCSA